MKKGVPISPGVAVAPAYCVDTILIRREARTLDADAVEGEVGRFEAAHGAAGDELDAIAARVSKAVGPSEAAIFKAHRQLLNDPALVGRVTSAIRQRHIDAAGALHELLDEYAKLFEQIDDEHLRERLADIRDVVGRLIAHLSTPGGDTPLDLQEAVIVVASEILPSQAVMFDRLNVAGILTEKGSSTGHAAILSRSLGIPAIAGLRGILADVGTHDLIAIDGREGHVHVRPSPEIESAYRKLARDFVVLRDRLIENREQEARSADGVAIELLANVNGLADTIMATKVGAVGVGLYRTEYLFLTHPSVPDEEEQYAAYRAVVEAAPNRRVTIRTLDLGGDKQVSYLGNRREPNPFMGWRSIRLSSAYPEFFHAQLRAILRAATHGQVSLLFPMISTLDEVRQLKRTVEHVKTALASAGIPFAENVPIGLMIEVPAAALCIDQLLGEVDFVSIGSNDLIQYVMAADRDNPRVAHLCEPFTPAIFRLLRPVIEACNAQGKPVTLCGEMAGRPRCVMPLFGMGLHRYSMSPAFVPTIKEVMRHTTRADAVEMAMKVANLSTVGDVRGYLTRRIKKLCPNVSQLDVRI